MTEINNEEVKEFVLDEDGNEIVNPELSKTKETETPSESSEENKEEEPEETPEEKPKEEPEEPPKEPEGSEPLKQNIEEEKKPKPVPGETPREYALRLEVDRLKKERRDTRSKELLGETPATAKKDIPPEKKKLLEKYKSEDVNTLKEILDVLADDFGFVRKDEYNKTTYEQSAGSELDSFLETHSEYQPENDKDNVLWNAFKTEFEFYRKPENPRDYRKIFAKVHQSIFGINSSSTDLKKVKAEQEKLKHISPAGATPPNNQPKKSIPVLDPSLGVHLKGFTEEEKKELFGA